MSADSANDDRPSAQWAALAVPALLGGFLLLTSATEFWAALEAFDEKRLLQSLLLTCCLALGLANPAVRFRFAAQLHATPRWMLRALAAAALLGIVSGARFAEFPYSLAEITLLALLLATGFVVAACRGVAPKAFDRLSLALLAALAVLVAARESLGLVASATIGADYGFENMLLNFYHPRFYNQLQTWMIPLLAAIPWVFRGARPAILAAVAIVIALQWCIVFVSGGRGTGLSVILAMTAVGVLALRQRPRWLLLQIAALAMGTLLYFALAGSGGDIGTEAAQPTLQHRGDRSLTQLTGRDALWTIAIGESVKHPLLGIGPARFACVVPAGTVAHPHNFPLQLAAEWGWPATVLIAVVVAALLRRAAVALRRGNDADLGGAVLTQCLGASLLAAALHSGLSGVLIMPASQVAAAWIGGWAGGAGLFGHGPAGAGAAAGRGAAPRNPRWAGAAMAVAVIVAAALSSWNAHEIERLLQREDFRATRQAMAPRHWSNGAVCGYAQDGAER